MTVVDKTLAVQYEAIHANKSYGVSGNLFLLPIQTLITELHPKTILNYGCGQTTFHEHLNLLGATYYRYDPGRPEFSKLPVEKADFLINTDVLEHIPEAQLDEAISKMASISQYALINIATRPAKEILPNGENAHCTIKTAEEWLPILQRHFPNVQIVHVKPGFSALFLTWDSPVKEVVEALTDMLIEMPLLKKRLAKAERSLSDRINAEFQRFKRRLSK